MKKFIFTIFILINAASVSAELYKRAPDVIPGTLPEMREASYWIDTMDNPDEIVLTPSQIQRMNETYQKRMSLADPFFDVAEVRKPRLESRWPGLVFSVPDLHKITPEAVADTVKIRIQSCIDRVEGRAWGNLDAVEYSPAQIQAFVNEMAIDMVGSTVTVLDAIAVRTSSLRNVPTFTPDQVGLRGNGKGRWDMFSTCIVKIGMPLKVLHVSRSGEYVFVLCEWGYGWARTEDVAFSNKAKIDAFVNADDFVVCTGDRVPFYTDASCTFASGYIRMGDHLPLADKNNARKVLAPARKMSGEFETEVAWLSKNANVSIGLLPYTRRNIVTTAFNLLDTTYDWSGGWLGRQHETTYRDIFLCFGFKLPYDGSLYTFFNTTAEQVLDPAVGREEQYKTILSHPPFITIQSCGGHCQLRFGEYNGVPILFDQHGYGYEDENGEYLEIRRCNIGVQTLPNYFLKNKITFLELR